MNKRAVIVEDEYFAANHIKKILQKNGYDVIAMYHDGETVMAELSTLKDTIFLLDIQLSKEVNGVDLASELDKRNIPFIFITANTEEGTFKTAIVTKPVAYISKPFKEIDIIAGVTLASQRIKNKITIESGKEKIRIDPEEILYIKSDSVYIEIFLENRNSYTIRKQLKAIGCELPTNFKRCHKSFIVNKEKITAIKGGFIYIDNVKIPISKTYRSSIT